MATQSVLPALCSVWVFIGGSSLYLLSKDITANESRYVSTELNLCDPARYFADQSKMWVHKGFTRRTEKNQLLP